MLAVTDLMSGIFLSGDNRFNQIVATILCKWEVKWSNYVYVCSGYTIIAFLQVYLMYYTTHEREF